MNKSDIPVGSLISTYFKGYYVLTRIDFQEDPEAPIFYFVEVPKNTKRKVKELSCSSHWCHLVTKDVLEKEKDEFLNFNDQLMKMAS